MYVRFERVEKPYSYNDSVITNLSWMKSEPNSSLPPLNNNTNVFNSNIEQQLLQQQHQPQDYIFANYVPTSIFETLNESNVLEFNNDNAKDTDIVSHKSENSLSDYELVKSVSFKSVLV